MSLPLTRSSAASQATQRTTTSQARSHKSASLRGLMGRLRKSVPELEHQSQASPALSSSSNEANTVKISKATKAFVDSLCASQVSDFLIWMLYYDLVELPISSTSWYMQIDAMEMRGWIVLGEFLKEIIETGEGYGLDLVVLDSICDRMGLFRSTVHSLLIQIADSEAMAHTTIATTVAETKQRGMSSIEALQVVRRKLCALNKLVVRLQPSKDSIYTDWQPIIQNRIQGYLFLVIQPRIDSFHSGRPLLMEATSAQLFDQDQEALRLKYLYEAMQQARIVPLHRYLHIGNNDSANLLPSSPLDSTKETERARNFAYSLMKDNQELRLEIESLRSERRMLTEANERLALRVTTLRGVQRNGFSRDLNSCDRTRAPRSGHQSIEAHPDSPIPRPSQRIRTRSVSQPQNSTCFSELSGRSHFHQRNYSDEPAGQYTEVFSGLEAPSSTFRLRSFTKLTNTPYQPTPTTTTTTPSDESLTNLKQ